jgi:hypothetical protein
MVQPPWIVYRLITAALAGQSNHSLRERDRHHHITIAAPNTDVSSSLVVLPGTFLDAGSQLRAACAARGGRPASPFAPGGRGGLPPDPGAPLAASLFESPPGQRTATGSAALTPRSPPAAEPIRLAGIPHPILGAPRPACRG